MAFAEAIEDGETLINGEITRQNPDGFAADFFRPIKELKLIIIINDDFICLADH